MNDRHPSGTRSPAPAPDADHASYPAYDTQGATYGGGFAQTPYAPDPYAQDSYSQDPYAQDAYAQVLYAQDPQGSFAQFDTGTYPQGAYAAAPYATDTFATGTYDTGTYATGTYDTGGYGNVAYTGTAQPTDAYSTGAFPTGTYATDPYAMGTYDTGTYDTAAFGHPSAQGTGAYDTGTWDTGAYATGTYDTGTYDTAAPNTAPYDTGSFETSTYATPYDTGSQPAVGYEAHAYDSGQWQFPQMRDHAAEPVPEPVPEQEPERVPERAQEHAPEAYTQPQDSWSATGFPTGDGGGTAQFDSVGPTADTTGEAVPEVSEPVVLGAVAAEHEDPAVAAGPGRDRHAARGKATRRRMPAKRSALLTIAVPSACVMGVAGVAAASVGDFGGESKEAGASSSPAPVKPAVANNKLDTQLARLSAAADDVADRASRTQERIDLKAKKTAEHKEALAEAARRERERPKFALPVAQRGLSAYFGQAGVNWMSQHTGIDFPVSYGTPVMSATDGTVRSQWNSAYGNMAIVTAKDGTETWYCHLSSTSLPSGTAVKAGQQIAHSGNSGNSTGPHMHFEVRPGGGAAIDPLPWLRSHGLNPT